MQVLGIDFAYPSSVAAVEMGFPSGGCWVVNLYKNWPASEHEHLKAFRDKDSAVEHARSLKIPFGVYWKHLAED